jgi:two-component sensor histidine kinase
MAPTTLDMLLEPSPEAASKARRSISDTLSEQLVGLQSPDKQDHLLLLTTELITNSVRHGVLAPDEYIRLWVTVDTDSVVVEVTDFGEGFQKPTALAPSLGATSGRGLYMVDVLAERWDVECDGETTLVWFELAL